MKDRSATEAALRTVTRAHPYLAKGEAVGLGFWDIKGGFQNIRDEDVTTELEKLEKGRKWISWVRGFFRARRFELEWDSKMSGRGKTNIQVP